MKKLIYLAMSIAILGCSSDDSPAPTPTPQPAEEKPVAVDDNFIAVENEDEIISEDDILRNDTLVDNALITGFDSETAEGGTVTDNRDGTLTYTPAEDFIGEDTFDYTICVPGDSDRCSTATITIKVSDAGAPIAEDDSYETTENQSYNITNFLDNDNLVDGATLTEINTDGTNGTVEIRENGTLRYTAVNGFSGVDTFTYTICDDDETPNCATATITVNVLDEGSPSASDDEVVVERGASNVILENLLSNDDLTDDAVLTSLNDTGSNATISITEEGTVMYTPAAGFTGTDSFTYTICDDDGTCSDATVTVTVVDPVSFNVPDALEDYYSGVTFSVDPTLLYQELSSYTDAQHTNRLEYFQRHDYLYDADADLDDDSMVVLMYSGELRPDDEYQLGDLDEGETYNTEHIYPQSKLNTEESKNDLHLLRVVDVDVNSERLNYPFTDGSGTYKLVNGDSWFPGDDWRGDVARIVMYVNLSYGDDFDEVGNLELFLKWNREDPVSAFEMQRNNVIEGAQGNRNPFIDNPYLATLIWGGDAAENRWE
ncbi:Ig-like domain-containing protein [Christiangramia sp. SM2212]|uniref:Ig-like domain-containing protein n=1 Tax=Christiangramia sediminicola TaxID=3073267 RepID=A0ABU1ESX1_9FLAO|nr:Ig-like domain-containing protein [Christiangramia sp. SM2212]MDR5591499.1 Ig-like domain-containing protein [Christiangramia sp. SM2212]